MAKKEVFTKNKKNDKHINNPPEKKKSGWLFYVLAVPVASVLTIILTFTGFLIHAYFRDLDAARTESEALQEIAAEILEYNENYNIAAVAAAPHHLSELDLQMLAINPDFICWIRIDGLPIDYPVVRGSDNEFYLNHSFYREENIFGALFMDYRNVGDFVPHIIIYGHNNLERAKFGTLHYLYDEAFLRNHNIITIIVNDRVVEYEIFSVRVTDIYDPAYFLDFRAPGAFHDFLERIGAPEDAQQILTLSTCLSAGDEEGRLIVQAALVI